MTSLFDIPSDLLRELLDEWLPIKSVGCLDSACCSHECRNTFLLQLIHVNAVRNGNCKSVCDFYDWVYLRKLLLEYLTLYDVMFDSNLKLKFSFDNSKVTHIFIHCLDKKYTKGYARVINACGALVKLDCYCDTSSDTIIKNITNLNQLVTLCLCDHNERSLTKSLNIVAATCTKLEDIKVVNSIPNLQTYELLFEQNPYLKSVEVSDDILEYLIKCKTIEIILLNDVDLNFEHLMTIIKGTKTIKAIRIAGSGNIFYYDLQKPGFKMLQYFSTSDTAEEELATFIDSVSNLNDVDLYGFCDLPASFVKNNASSLTVCNFGHVELTHNSLRSLSQHCVNLTSLSLSLNNISVDDFNEYNMRRLETLHVHDCVSPSDIVPILRSFESLRKCSFVCNYERKIEIERYKTQLHEFDVQSGRNIRCDYKIDDYHLDYQQGRFGGRSHDEYLSFDEIAVRAANNNDDSWYTDDDSVNDDDDNDNDNDNESDDEKDEEVEEDD